MMYSQNDKKIGILNGFRKQNSFGRLLKIYCKFFSADLMHCPWYICKVSKKKKKIVKIYPTTVTRISQRGNKKL